MKKKIILFSIIAIIVVGLIIGAMLLFNNQKTTNNSNEDTPSIPTPPTSSYQGINEQDKSIFNSNFDIYSGKNISGTKVKMLISTIKSSNEKSEIGKVDLVINGESTIDSSKIDKSKTYSVSFDYNKNGLINKAIIEDN